MYKTKGHSVIEIVALGTLLTAGTGFFYAEAKMNMAEDKEYCNKVLQNLPANKEYVLENIITPHYNRKCKDVLDD